MPRQRSRLSVSCSLGSHGERKNIIRFCGRQGLANPEPMAVRFDKNRLGRARFAGREASRCRQPPRLRRRICSIDTRPMREFHIHISQRGRYLIVQAGAHSKKGPDAFLWFLPIRRRLPGPVTRRRNREGQNAHRAVHRLCGSTRECRGWTRPLRRFGRHNQKNNERSRRGSQDR